MKDDVVIYCDGFLKHKKYRNGCSVAVVVNDVKVLHEFFEVSGMVALYLKRITLSGKVTTFMMELFAIYNALLLARRYKCVIIYSDAMGAVQKITNRSDIDEDTTLGKWYKRCRYYYNKLNVKVLWITRKTNVKILGH